MLLSFLPRDLFIDLVLLLLLPSLEIRRPRGPVACTCLCLGSAAFSRANTALDRQGKCWYSLVTWYNLCALLSPAFVVLVINAAHTEPGDTPNWADPWAFPTQHHFQVLHSPCQQCKSSGQREMRNQKAWQHWSARLFYALLSGDFYAGQNLLSVSDSALGEGAGSVPRGSEPVSRVRIDWCCPAPPTWCVWSWTPYMCPYREGCNYLVDIG